MKNYSTRKKIFKIAGFLIAVAVALFAGYEYYSHKKAEGKPIVDLPSLDDGFNQHSYIFNRDLSELNLGVTGVGDYFLKISPEDKYLAWGGFDSAEVQPENKMFITDLEADATWRIPGDPVGDWDKDNLFITKTETGIVLNDLEKRTSEEVAEPENILSGSVSPDGRRFVYNTPKGIKVLDLVTKKIDTISSKRNDSANAWMSDSIHLLGYKGDAKSPYVDGDSNYKPLAIWDRQSKLANTDTEVNVVSTSIKDIKWLEQDKLALVTAEYYGAVFGNIVDLEKKGVSELGPIGETEIMGMDYNEDLGLIAIIEVGDSNLPMLAKFLDKNTNTVSQQVFTDNRTRLSPRILSSDKMIYLRKRGPANEPDEVVVLDFKNGTEKVLGTLGGYANSIVVTKNEKYWIAANKGVIVLQPI